MTNPKIAYHPWEYVIDELNARKWTQKQFAEILWKKVSEVNELIKWKRNITPMWAILIATAFGWEAQTWLNLQSRYDYYKTNKTLKRTKINQIIKRVREIDKVVHIV